MDMISGRADEVALKASFLEHLLRAGDIARGSLIANEYQVDGAARRADLAVLSRGIFIGIEIKSEFDSLSRLVAQTDAYLKVFDKVLVLVAEKHLSAAQQLLSPLVAIYGAGEDGRIAPSRDPVLTRLCDEGGRRSAILRALPKTSLEKLAARKGERCSRSALMAELRSESLSVLRSALVAEFAHRYEATSKSFWALLQRRRAISPSYLSVLSRFAPIAKSGAEQKERQRERWDAWLSRRQSPHES